MLTSKSIKKCIETICLLTTMLMSIAVHSQFIQQRIKADSTLQANKSREILYVNTDQPSYLCGDTIWYSAWLMDAYYRTPFSKSGIAYVELLSPEGTLVDRQAIRIYGHAYSQMPIKGNLPSGIYHLRAYTQWMRNFPNSLFSQKDIPILGSTESWRMDLAHYSRSGISGNDSIGLIFTLSSNDNKPVANRKVSLRLKSGNGKIILSSNLNTTPSGKLNINFRLLKDKESDNISVHIIDRQKEEERISFPLGILNSSVKDLQFLPESGLLLSGIQNLVAFKAIDKRGLPVDADGTIVGSKGDTITHFSSTHDGMGSFYIIPQRGERYHAVLEGVEDYLLPEADSIGTILTVDALSSTDSIYVSIQKKGNSIQDYYLLGYCRGLVVGGLRMNNSLIGKRLAFAKNSFPSGVCHFSLMTGNGQLLNERAFYVENTDNLSISVNIKKDSIYTQDSIPLEITVNDNNGKPVSGLFSLCVTDTSVVSKDPSKEDNILSYYLLSSDVRGTVYRAGYYFYDSDSIKRKKALDNLLLTQGFVRYDWDAAVTKYKPEQQFQVSGRVAKLFNKPYQNGIVNLLSMKPSFITMDTTTNSEGYFTFSNFPLFDTAAFTIRAKTKKGKEGRLSIEIDKNDYPISPEYGINSWMGDINIDTKTKKRIETSYLYAAQKTDILPGELAPVTVTSKFPIEGSSNLNGSGMYDEAITKSQLQKMEDSTLLDILKKRVKNFRIGRVGKEKLYWYMIGPMTKLIFIIDGIRMDNNFGEYGYPGVDESMTYLSYLNDYLTYIKAPDIKGIEVLRSGQYTEKYFTEYLNSTEKNAYGAMQPIAYIEITTYSKHGPFVKEDPSQVVYRPMPFSTGKTYYEPRYVNNISPESLPRRATISWQPQFVTDSAGKAILHFFPRPETSGCLITVEGTDGNGRLGWKAQYIDIRKD